jgi:hypothetical protein
MAMKTRETPATPPAPATSSAPALPESVAALLAAVAPAAGTSKTVIAGGIGASGLAVFIADRLLANDGQLAASMLTKLSPVLGPVWASWPVILILLGAVLWGAGKWSASQKARAAADIAAALAAADLSHKVGDVATGLAGLRVEVHELRGALQDHADATDARLRSHDEGLRAVQADVSVIAKRVDVLERPDRQSARPRRPRAR